MADREEDTAAAPAPSTALERRWSELRAAVGPVDVRVTVIMLVAAVMLLVFKKYGGSETFEGLLAPEPLRSHPRLSVLGDYYWFLSCFVMLGVVPFALAMRAMRGEAGSPGWAERARELGAGLGDVRFGLRWTAILFGVMLPVVAIASRSATFSQYYPLNGQLGTDAVDALANGAKPGFWAWFLGYELLYAVYFIGWEFFFRGFMTLGLYPRLGVNAVLASNIPFVLLHAGKPFPEGLGSLIAGIALGALAIRSRSFWYCWLLHAAIAVSMDLLAIQRRLELILGQ